MAEGAKYDRHPPEVVMCSVLRTDANNAVCTTHNPDCQWATPYGNYCEHARVYQLGEFIMPGEATFPWPLKSSG